MPTTKLGQFSVSYDHSEEFHRLKTEIFTHDCYYFQSSTVTPLIIDAGAHIGLATLYFKKLYPAAEIIALEPHPDNFRLLSENVYQNSLDNVEPLNTALALTDDLLELHEDKTAERWFSTASALPGAWNGQQQTHTIVVPALKLTTLLSQLDRPVDLLKLNIEGLELAVLQNSTPALHLINKMLIEHHPHPQNRLIDLLELLSTAGFDRLVAYKDQTEVDLTNPPSGLIMIEAHRG